MRDFTEYLEGLIVRFGSQTAVAAAIEIEAAKLSRFRSDQNGLNKEEIDRLLLIGEAVIVTRQEVQQYEDTIEHLTIMWRRERQQAKEAQR